MRRERPYRAVAYYPMPPGRLVVARTSAASIEGLAAFIERHDGVDGKRVDSWQVQPLPGLDDAQAADEAPAGLRSPS